MTFHLMYEPIQLILVRVISGETVINIIRSVAVNKSDSTQRKVIFGW